MWALLLAALLALPVPAAAQVQDGATLTVLRGQVAVVRSDGSAVQPAPSGTVVRAGDEIRTLTKAGALITFFVGTEIEMGEDTVIQVEQVNVQSGAVNVSLKQVVGMTLNRVTALSDPRSSYRIDAGGAVAVVRGTTFLMFGPTPDGFAGIVCLSDCDSQTTFAGCRMAQNLGYWVEVARNQVVSECQAFVPHGGFWNGAAEAITSAAQAAQGTVLGVPPGQLPGGSRQELEAKIRQALREPDRPPTAASGSGDPCAPTEAPPPGGTTISVGGVSRFEGNAGTQTFQFPVSLSASSAQVVTVQYATQNGTATAGSDYTATSGTLSFAPGVTNQNVNVQVSGDTVVEPDETFTLQFANPTNATFSGSSLATGTIRNDDGPPDLRVFPAFVTEGNTGTTNLVFLAILNRPAITTVAVNYSTSDGTATAGSDYAASGGTAVINVGLLTTTISVPVSGDVAIEPDETLFLNLSGAVGANLLTTQTIGLIADDDGPITVSVQPGFATEGGCGSTSTLQFLVTLNRTSTSPVTVQYATSNGSATAGADYTAASGTATIPAGSLSATVTVAITPDTTAEPVETFNLTLSNPTNAVIGTGTATGTIFDDD
ncbi:MAG: Calx-beta domain-containing protein [Chloroflexota bacterium]